jgi:hypothetical protein
VSYNQNIRRLQSYLRQLRFGQVMFAQIENQIVIWSSLNTIKFQTFKKFQYKQDLDKYKSLKQLAAVTIQFWFIKVPLQKSLKNTNNRLI